MPKPITTLLLVTFFMLGTYHANAQTPKNNELVTLHVITTLEMNAITSPIQGSLIFNSGDNEVYHFNGTLWDRISSTGNETKIIEGDDITITGTGTTLDPYVINYSPSVPIPDLPVTNCSGGAQANACVNLNSTTNGIYCIDDDGNGPNSPYLTYCDMNTDGGGWARVVRTTSNNQQFGQKNHNYSYVNPTAASGIYETYAKIKNFNKVMIKKVGTSDYASYNLVNSISGESIYDLMTFAKNQPNQYSNDSAWDGTRVKGMTSEYSGTKTSGNLNFNYFFMCGVNESSDNDQAYMSFSDSRGSSNSWGDRWRGLNQKGTLWSLLNGDYYRANNYHIGNGYSQAGAGYKGNNTGTYEVFVK